MAVNKSKKAKKYSINAFNLLFFTRFLIAEPNAAQGDIDNGQIINAIKAIKKIEKTKLPSLGKNPDAAILEIVHAFGLTIWNNAASYNFKGLESSSLILLKEPIILYPRYNKYIAHITLSIFWISGKIWKILPKPKQTRISCNICPIVIPEIWGMVFIKPNFKPEVRTIALFGPGVTYITK